MKLSLLPALACLSAFFVGCVSAQIKPAADLPHLEKRGSAVQLVVDGKPCLLLAGEIRNSSSSNRDYMRPIWTKLAQMHLNTVLAVVSWDMIEPREGAFDFSEVDQLLADARAHNMHLVLLWFGSWKNGFSHYVPEWVKTDSARFPRALTRFGTPEILTPLCEASREADAKAFAAVMRHLRENDAQQHTVVMIQVENEVGLHADSRDRSALAEASFKSPVPVELTKYLRDNRDSLRPGLRALWQSSGFKETGTWSELFGTSEAAEEAFMAWHYARYLNRVAEAGKQEYALPMFVNTWIVQPEDEHPGEYPSGGPQAHVHDMWKAGAPLIDILAPDIYLPNFGEVCSQYVRRDAGFFVPESRFDAEGAANAFQVIGSFNSVGYSPFAIEHDPNPEDGAISRAYATLGSLAPLILESQARGEILAFSLSLKNTTQVQRLGGIAVRAGLLAERRSGQLAERGYGIVMAAGRDEFIAVGSDLQISFSLDKPDGTVLGLAWVEEGRYSDGKWIPGRRLNGDEIMLSYDVPATASAFGTGTGLKLTAKGPVILRAKLYRYPQAR
jgi:hypothetical protein